MINEQINSRQLAKKWPVTRHKIFVNDLRKAASKWFNAKGLTVNPRMSYCLNKWDEWENNIILEEVVHYIKKIKEECENKKKPFPLHKYVHHGLSSQAMAFNLIGPLITRNDFTPLTQLLYNKNINNVERITSATFEYENRNIFNEDSGQPTSIDIVLNNEEGKPHIFIESKLVEKEFGGCSVFSAGDCNGKNPLPNKESCYLHFIGRRYWKLIEKYGFSEKLKSEQQCVFVTHYQFFRELLFSLEEGGNFILLSDERSPVFYSKVYGDNNGLMPFLLSFVPQKYRLRITSISVQELRDAIKETGSHRDWIGEFEKKYGMT